MLNQIKPRSPRAFFNLDKGFTIELEYGNEWIFCCAFCGRQEVKHNSPMPGRCSDCGQYCFMYMGREVMLTAHRSDSWDYLINIPEAFRWLRKFIARDIRAFMSPENEHVLVQMWDLHEDPRDHPLYDERGIVIMTDNEIATMVIELTWADPMKVGKMLEALEKSFNRGEPDEEDA